MNVLIDAHDNHYYRVGGLGQYYMASLISRVDDHQYNTTWSQLKFIYGFDEASCLNNAHVMRWILFIVMLKVACFRTGPATNRLFNEKLRSHASVLSTIIYYMYLAYLLYNHPHVIMETFVYATTISISFAMDNFAAFIIFSLFCWMLYALWTYQGVPGHTCKILFFTIFVCPIYPVLLLFNNDRNHIVSNYIPFFDITLDRFKSYDTTRFKVNRMVCCVVIGIIYLYCILSLHKILIKSVDYKWACQLHYVEPSVTSNSFHNIDWLVYHLSWHVLYIVLCDVLEKLLSMIYTQSKLYNAWTKVVSTCIVALFIPFLIHNFSIGIIFYLFFVCVRFTATVKV